MTFRKLAIAQANTLADLYCAYDGCGVALEVVVGEAVEIALELEGDEISFEALCPKCDRPLAVRADLIVSYYAEVAES